MQGILCTVEICCTSVKLSLTESITVPSVATHQSWRLKVSLVTGKGDEREPSSEKCEANELWGTKDREPWRFKSRLCCISFSRITPFDDFMDIYGMTHLNSASDSPWLSQSWGHIQPLIESHPQSNHLSIYILSFSHDESMCFILLLIFCWFIIWFIMLTNAVMRWELSGTFSCSLLSHCLQIVKMWLSCSCFPHVYKEAVLPQRKDNLVLGFILSSALFIKFIWQSWLQYHYLSSILSTILIMSLECVYITSSVLYHPYAGNPVPMFPGDSGLAAWVPTMGYPGFDWGHMVLFEVRWLWLRSVGYDWGHMVLIEVTWFWLRSHDCGKVSQNAMVESGDVVIILT